MQLIPLNFQYFNKQLRDALKENRPLKPFYIKNTFPVIFNMD